MLRVVVGLPVASEDDAGRAIRLALALVDALDGIGSDVEPELRLALAVQRGVALGASRRSTDAKSRAARVRDRGVDRRVRAQARAPGARRRDPRRRPRVPRRAQRVELRGAARDRSARRLARRHRPRASRSVDEDTDPGVKRARVYRLRGPKERAQRLRERRADAGRLHGRDLELKALRDAWRDVLVTKRKRQIVIVGDAGVGKRTLVRHVPRGHRARRGGRHPHRARASAPR